jgi:hypothetical protein
MPTLPPPIDALPELYLRLVRRVERLEGRVSQLLVERMNDAALHLALRDVQDLRSELQVLRSDRENRRT